MSTSDTMDAGPSAADRPALAGSSVRRRSWRNSLVEPILPFKLLAGMLGSTVVVGALLAVFLRFAFAHVFISMPMLEALDFARYRSLVIVIAALMIIYVLLLTAICVLYTHRLTGPLRPFGRHVDALAAGDHAARVRVRRSDLPMHHEIADRLNELAEACGARTPDGKERAPDSTP